MSGGWAKVLVLAGLVFAVTASSGASASPARGPILGVISRGPSPSLFGTDTTFGSGPVLYHGGQVMRTNTAYAIYWVPSGFSVDSSYESLINRYFGDVAAASGSQSNVYSVATQYYDADSSIHYGSTFGGSYVDTRPFPENGCSGAPVCLTDQQLQDEIQNVLTAKGWQGGTNSVFFVMTPKGVASCIDSASTKCTTTHPGFCAYHSSFFDSSGTPVIYADEPYAGAISGCTFSLVGTQGFPNDHDADATINTISHEHNESITDPFGDAWWANDGEGDETADLCAADFGSTPLGTVNGQPYDQLINGHPYSLQEEYSNDNGACVADYTPSIAPVLFAPPSVTGPAGEGRVLATSDGSWKHAPSGYAYQWQRCSASGAGCSAVSGATGTTYQLTAADLGHVVRAEVSAHNAAGTTGFVPSAPSPVVVAPPTATAPPVLSGKAAVGKKLSTTGGMWSTTVTFSYQWLRCRADGTGCKKIRGARAATHRSVAKDAGHRLEARVSASNAADTAEALSGQSAVVIDIPRARKGPRISGSARLGRRLSASRGSWSGPPKRFRYQWLRCDARGRSCVRIRHATRPKYLLTQLDAGHRLRVRITAVGVAGRGKAISRATARVH
jgi:hypothetical protein